MKTRTPFFLTSEGLAMLTIIACGFAFIFDFAFAAGGLARIALFVSAAAFAVYITMNVTKRFPYKATPLDVVAIGAGVVAVVGLGLAYV